MKIVFDSEEERNEFIDSMMENLNCPRHLMLPIDECVDTDCRGCWIKTVIIHGEVKPNGQG